MHPTYSCTALNSSWRLKILLKIVLPCSWQAAKAEHRTGQGIRLDLSMFSFHAWFDRLHWLEVPKDKGKAPILQSRANKTAPVCVVNPLYLVRRKAHNPVWDDGESRDMVNQNILGLWISTPFPAQLWVCWRTSLPACKAVTKGIPTLFCRWLPSRTKTVSLLINHANHVLRKLILKEDALLLVGSTKLFSNLSTLCKLRVGFRACCLKRGQLRSAGGNTVFVLGKTGATLE